MKLTYIMAFLCLNISNIITAQNNMNTYKYKGLELEFKYNFQVWTQEPKNKESYFYQATEIVCFNERKREELPEGVYAQSLTPKQMLVPPQSLEESTITENEKRHYSPIENDFHDDDVLYILPAKSFTKTTLYQTIRIYLESYPKYAITEELQQEMIGNQYVWTWRIQLGKTRLDHYLIVGEDDNYLFVSSPYSDANGSIRRLIEQAF